MTLPSPEPAHQPTTVLAGTVATRLWDAVKTLATVTLHLQTLEKEDARAQASLLELSRTVLDLAKDVRDMIGQMKVIEKRLEDKDKMIEAIIKLRIMEEVEKIRAELRRDSMVQNS